MKAIQRFLMGLVNGQDRVNYSRELDKVLLGRESMDYKLGLGPTDTGRSEKFRSLALSHLRRINGVISIDKAQSACQIAADECLEQNQTVIRKMIVRRWLACRGHSFGKLAGKIADAVELL